MVTLQRKDELVFAQLLSPYFSKGNKHVFKSSSGSKNQTPSLPTDLFGYHTFFNIN